VLIVVGVLLLVGAARRWRGRTGGGEEVPLPAWMGALDRLKPAAALAGGVVLGGVRPKSLLLVVGGAAAIAQTGIAGGQQAIAYAVFAVVATIGVGAPVVIYLVMGERSAELLGVPSGLRCKRATGVGSLEELTTHEGDLHPWHHEYRPPRPSAPRSMSCSPPAGSC
jgi:hypothetical protein